MTRRLVRAAVAGGLALLGLTGVSSGAVHAPSGGSAAGSFQLPHDLNDSWVEPGGIAAASDGTVWIVAGDYPPDTVLVHVGPHGVLKSLSTPDDVHGLARMTDNSIWYSVDQSTSPFRISPSGAVTRVVTKLPIGKYDWVGDLAAGKGGTVWFDAGEGRIVQLTASGTVKHVYRPLGADGRMLATDPSGNVWLTTVSSKQAVIAEMRAGGALAWQLHRRDFADRPEVFTFAADGSFVFVDGAALSRIAPDGTLSPVPVSAKITVPISGLAFDSTGVLWFASADNLYDPAQGSLIGAIAGDGTTTLYPQDFGPTSLAFDSTGRLWFGGGKTVRVSSTPPASQCAVPDLYGAALADAQAALQQTTCSLAPLRGTPTGTVFGQTPPPGTHLAAGAQVTLLIGQGRPGVTGTWEGTVTSDYCAENGTTTPDGGSEVEKLVVGAGTNGKLTASLAGVPYTATGQKGSSYVFGNLTVTLHFPSVSIVVAHPSKNCGEVDDRGDLLRTADS